MEIIPRAEEDTTLFVTIQETFVHRIKNYSLCPDSPDVPLFRSFSMELVELNVGGTLFTSTSRTLLKYPDSRIARLTRLWIQRRRDCSRKSSSCLETPNNGPVLTATSAAATNAAATSTSAVITTTVWERKDDEFVTTENNAPAGTTATAVGEPQQLELLQDASGRLFMDRSGDLFGAILDFLRSDGRVMPPEGRVERERLKQEAEWYGLSELRSSLERGGNVFRSSSAGLSVGGALSGSDSAAGPATVTLGYRGTFSFGRESLSDVKFRKMSRILVCGRVAACRAVFGETLNESRDPDRSEEGRYSSRFYLKHTCLEQAFDMLLEAGFRLGSACGCGSAHGLTEKGLDNEEAKRQRCAFHVPFLQFYSHSDLSFHPPPILPPPIEHEIALQFP